MRLNMNLYLFIKRLFEIFLIEGFEGIFTRLRDRINRENNRTL